MILTDLGQMRDQAKQLLRQSRGPRGNELHAEEVVHENCPANYVGGWSGSVITLVHEDTQLLCYAIFCGVWLPSQLESCVCRQSMPCSM